MKTMTYHICSLILLPSSSMVLILKSIPERKLKRKRHITECPFPKLHLRQALPTCTADNTTGHGLWSTCLALGMRGLGLPDNKPGANWRTFSSQRRGSGGSEGRRGLPRVQPAGGRAGSLPCPQPLADRSPRLPCTRPSRHTGPRAPRRWSFCTCCSLSTVGPTPPPVSPAYLSLSLNPKHPPSSGSPPPLRPQNEVSSSLQGPGWREHPLLPPSLTKWLLLKHPRHAPASGLLCLLFRLSECSFLPWPLGFLLPSLLGSGKVPSSGESS